MIQAVIFDMDGLLIDSEPIWQETEVALFRSVGIPVTLAMSTQTMGLRSDEVVRYWHHRYPWKTPSQTSVATDLIDRMVMALEAADIAMPGVQEAFAVVAAAGLPIAIASSSPIRLIHAAIKNLGIADKLQEVQSAEHEEYGKPHPGVYIRTAKKLGVAPEHCLAFEDSINGVIAAKAAKMHCIAIPDPAMRSHKAYGIADLILDSLDEFTPAVLKNLSVL
jgi:beta-phosphoglucomutase-like phosphatase (HAD superfamily)